MLFSEFLCTAVCRVCRAGAGGRGDVKVHSLDEQLLELYEKLASTKIDLQDVHLCYICYSQLQKCNKFAKMARKSEEYLNSVEFEDATINTLNVPQLQTLSVTTLKPQYCDGELGRKPRVEQDKTKTLVQKEITTGFEISKRIPNFPTKVELVEGTVEKTCVPDKKIILELNKPNTKQMKRKSKTCAEKVDHGIKLSKNLLNDKTDSKRVIKNKPKKGIIINQTKKNSNETLDKLPTQTKGKLKYNKYDKNNEVDDEKFLSNEVIGEEFTTEHKKAKSKNEKNEEVNIDLEVPNEMLYLDVTEEVVIEDSEVDDYVVINDTELYYECEECKNIFPNREELTSHQETHKTKEKQTKYDLDEIVKNLPRTKKPYCPICKKFLVGYASQLNNHLKIHTGDRPYVCDICGHTSRTKAHLLEHMRVHTKQKVQCKVCDKTFTQTSSLGKHMAIHTGIMAHFCHICGKTFSQNGQLRMHIRSIHEGIKRHCCEVCGKRFPGKSEWRRHMDAHAGIKAFSCDKCGMKLATNSALKRHKTRSICKG